MRLQFSSLKGLELIIPSGTNSSAALKFIKEHENWIAKRKLKPSDGFLWLGRNLKIIKETHPHEKYYKLNLNEDVLTISGPFPEEVNIKPLYEAWLYNSAKKFLTGRTLYLSELHGFHPSGITVRRQTSRWGSCSRKGNISLNYKLMKYPENIIDYVIIHELCHLKELNHSAKFWKLVEHYVPDYREMRKKLKGI